MGFPRAKRTRLQIEKLGARQLLASQTPGGRKAGQIVKEHEQPGQGKERSCDHQGAVVCDEFPCAADRRRSEQGFNRLPEAVKNGLEPVYRGGGTGNRAEGEANRRSGGPPARRKKALKKSQKAFSRLHSL